MPLDLDALQHVGGGAWRYLTRDDATAVNAPGYWTGAWPLLRRGDAVFRTTVDAGGAVVSAGRHVITAASRAGVSSGNGFDAGSVITPPPGDAQLTSFNWNLRVAPAILAGGAGGGNINYSAGRHDHRADADSQITTANSTVSSWASGQGFSGVLSQSASGNRPSHVAASDIVQFSGSTAANDTTNGKWFELSSGIVSRYASTPNALGVAYFLLRFPTLPTWTTSILRIGTNSNFYTNRDRLAYTLLVTASVMSLNRGSNTTNVAAQIASRPAANEWVALAAVLNDDRTTPGTSDQISRLFAKTKPGGTYATMQTASSTALSVSGASWNNAGGNAEGRINQVRFNASATTEGIGNLDLHSFGFDDAPPTSNAGIEAVLDTLLGRV
jgi:hypothetical protein